ncbi:hypothetical protein Bbelb_408700 [Branchiostoma belcheri]|nr:hypothetical protein Bbelb_408700 [Branchiostoma belcheri]
MPCDPPIGINTVRGKPGSQTGPAARAQHRYHVLGQAGRRGRLQPLEITRAKPTADEDDNEISKDARPAVVVRDRGSAACGISGRLWSVITQYWKNLTDSSSQLWGGKTTVVVLKFDGDFKWIMEYPWHHW